MKDKILLKKIFLAILVTAIIAVSQSGLSAFAVQADEDPVSATAQTQTENDATSLGEEVLGEGETQGENLIAISPRVGTINADIDLTPVHSQINSGEIGAFRLNLKVTGALTAYNNARVIISLPNNAVFSQDLDELLIEGVRPVYNSDQKTLTYSFSQLVSGETYNKTIKVTIENGTTFDGTTLNATASFRADAFPLVSDTASITVLASGALSINKAYSETEGKPEAPPVQGDTGIWTIAASLDAKKTGLMYAKEGSLIIITDTIPNGTTYVSDDSGGIYNEGKITWIFDAPTIEEQRHATDFSFAKTIQVKLRFNEEITNGSVLENRAEIATTLINDSPIRASQSASVQIAQGSNPVPTPTGIYLTPFHSGPYDAYGLNGYIGNLDPFPTVYDWASLAFRTQITSGEEGARSDFRSYILEYTIDPHLFLDYVTVRAPHYATIINDPNEGPLNRLPTLKISAKVNGTWHNDLVTITNSTGYKKYNIEELGFSRKTKIEMLKFDYGNAPQGMFDIEGINYRFNIEEGFVGKVENIAHYYGIAGNGSLYDWGSTDSANLRGPRHATVASLPSDVKPITTISTIFNDTDGNRIVPGNNRITVQFNNTVSSIAQMNEPLQTMIILPESVRLAANPNPNYTDASGRQSLSNPNALGGSWSVITDDYLGTGKQLIKVDWNDTKLLPKQFLAVELDVIIADNALTPLNLYAHGFTGSPEISVPSISGTPTINDSVLEQDARDINDNGNTEEYYVKSGNTYMVLRDGDIQTEKFIKGSLDSEYSQFGHTVPGGEISYLLKLTNTNGAKISNMTLIDVLPSAGDLGITDNVDRGSMFTPYLTGAVQLPNQWQGKVEVSYSSSANPLRDDLVKNVVYPDTTEQLRNPIGSTDPGWITEEAVSDWNTIHSFKIELKEGETWVPGQDITLQFNMKAPEYIEIGDKSLMDPKKDELTRAAWNSFAFAVNHLQAVEPARVGVVINAEEPTIHKDVAGEQHLDLVNRHDVFAWNVRVPFGDTPSSWSQAKITDRINSLMEIVNVSVVDENGIDVMGNGSMQIDNNLVIFNLHQKEGSYAYLAKHTYTLVISTKIKESVTEEQLAPFIRTGGIPNQARLSFGNDGESIVSEIPTVTPPPITETTNQQTQFDAVYKLSKTGDLTGAAVVLFGMLVTSMVLIVLTKRTKRP